MSERPLPVRRGNPFKKYEEHDFRLDQKPVIFDRLTGLSIISRANNRVRFQVEKPEFALTMRGFDTNRDLVVDVREVKNETPD